jgi:hypothetical protein
MNSKKNTISLVLSSILFLCLCITTDNAFALNKVQYETTDWTFIQSAHFDVYYYQGGYDQAVFTADVADSAYQILTKDYNWELAAEDRIVIVTYQSHNDFSNTNLSQSLIPESVGGFTEFYKNRVVIPFQGDWEAYRHVIHHELNHAFQLKMFYGESILAGAIRFPIPLWFAEGTSEYTSRDGWDREANMFMADAATAGYLPDIQYLSGFLAYKGGQSVFCYIEDEFGREKIAELAHKIKSLRNIERAFESTLGFNVQELSTQWKAYLKRIYWPTIGTRQTAVEIADQITDHYELRNFVNNSPAISPNGDRMVFLSDRTGYFDLYCAHITDPQKPRKILHGQQSGKFEELHWLQPGISWSPDEKSIVFASKAAARDGLFLIDPVSGKINQKYSFDYDGVFSPSWSPDGKSIAFVALHDGRSDIRLLDLASGEDWPITNDRWSDFDPSFSADGSKILFTSDRGADLSTNRIFNINGQDYFHNDIYYAEISGFPAGSKNVSLTRVTDSKYNKRTPIWVAADYRPQGSVIQDDAEFSDAQDEIFFVCDAGGAWNLYSLPADVQQIESPQMRTNMLTGIFQPSVSKHGKLLFSSFEKGGYDIYMLKNVQQLEYLDEMPEDDSDMLPFNRLRQGRDLEVTNPITAVDSLSDYDDEAWRQVDFSRINELSTDGWADWGSRRKKKKSKQELNAQVRLPDSKTVERFDADGNYLPKEYKLKFSPDMAVAQAQYHDLFGFQGVSQIVFSDLMGNHRIYAYLNLYDRIELSNVFLFYQFMANRINWEGGVFRYVRNLSAEVYDRYYQDNYYGLELKADYPLDRFTNLSLSNSWTTIERDSLNQRNFETDRYGNAIYKNYLKGKFLTSTMALTFDNTLWGSTGPKNGLRSSAAYTRGFPVAGGKEVGNDFHTFEFDMRRYYRLNPDMHFAMRFSGGISGGDTPQRFFMGGSSNWINAKFNKSENDDSDNLLRSDINELYYSVLVQPLRGAALYAKEGNRFVLGNAEFRFPLLHYLVTGWPLTIVIRDLRGSIFADLGTAWDHNSSSYDGVDEDGHLDDIMLGYGWGIRFNAGIALIKFDWAWNSKLDGNPYGPQFVFSLGTEF